MVHRRFAAREDLAPERADALPDYPRAPLEHDSRAVWSLTQAFEILARTDPVKVIVFLDMLPGMKRRHC